MSEPDEIHHRVTRLEHQMIKVQQDASAARVLAGAVDRDVSEFRAVLQGHTKVLNALRKDQIEGFARLDGRLSGVDGRLNGVDGRFDKLEGRFNELEAEMRNGFTTVNLGMAQITALLTTVIDKSDDAGSS
jgi:hypothetical protein